jgi:8-oxo-dGTP pyrophosphatase MutT (NUDIX family)
MNDGKFYPDSEWLSALQAAAEKDGRECVVGALIKNGAGAIFVQKRAMDRRLFPGCWDIAGGHVEAGETLFEALAREVEEETGWQLVKILDMVKVFDWEKERNGRIIEKREFDFLVQVDGDLTVPQIEVGKFSEFRWLGWADRELLLENRESGYAVIYELVKLALEAD